MPLVCTSLAGMPAALIASTTLAIWSALARMAALESGARVTTPVGNGGDVRHALGFALRGDIEQGAVGGHVGRRLCGGGHGRAGSEYEGGGKRQGAQGRVERQHRSTP